MAATGYLGNLTDEQQAALDSMKQQISALLLASDAEPATPQAPVDGADEATSRVLLKLSPAERELFVDDRIMLRFLRARKFNVERAVTMYIAAGNWRRTFHDTGVEMVSELDCPNELASGKSFFYKYDKEGRVVTYIRVRYHDPAKTDMREIQRYTIFIMELGKKLMRLPQENGVIVYDMAEFGLNNMDNEYMKFQIHVMQNYYPESLGLCLVVNAPWIFWTCWNLIQYWIDPVSREKVKFISTAELPQYIDIDDIPKEFGGNDPFEYRYIPPAQREGTGYIPPWEMEWATAPLRVRAEPATPETPAGDTPAPAEQKSGWGWWQLDTERGQSASAVAG